MSNLESNKSKEEKTVKSIFGHTLTVKLKMDMLMFNNLDIVKIYKTNPVNKKN